MSRFINCLQGKKKLSPFWFMRQAGRYLPEYREIRSRQKDFLSFCYSPEAAKEVTMQPLRRFDMDAAILFSDILVIPDALGQPLRYEDGQGPLLEAISTQAEIDRLDESRIEKHLAPVFEAVHLIRNELTKDKALIGFAGAPWTVACYMIEGKGSKDFAQVRKLAYADEAAFQSLVDKLVRCTVTYLSKQIEAGADAVQMFDSWAGILPEGEFAKWVIKPTQQIIQGVKARYPHIPFIAFPRGASLLLHSFLDACKTDAMGLDTSVPMSWAKEQFSKRTVLQGNLDPLLIASDKQKAVDETKRLLELMQDTAFIFNLGHGFIPQTPIENVQAVSETIIGYRG